MNTALTIVTAVLSSTVLSQLITFFVNRHDAKKKIPEKLDTLEKDTLRTQLLLLILMKPDARAEILTIGEHYFKVLHGDWYMTNVFNQWCMEHGQNPSWFDREA